MEQQSYYRDIDNPGCDMPHEGEPLVLNCAGVCYIKEPFNNKSAQGRTDYYLQYMTKGCLTAWPMDTPQDFTEGMFVIYSPHTPYRYELAPGEEMQYYWIHFSGFHVVHLLRNLGIETNRIYLTDGSDKRKTRILSRFRQIFTEFMTFRPGADDSLGALLTQILVDLARGVDKLTTGEKRKLESLQYLHSHYREDTSIASLAQMEHLSVSRYRDVFRKQTGFSPMDYRTALRMQHACDLLSMTDSTITKIGEECGYPDVMYFIRIFKQKKGLTPGEYRKQYHSKES